MSRAKPPVTPEVIEQHFAEIANQRKSHLEMTYVPAPLTPDELSLLTAYRTIWERGASETLDLALLEADLHPRRTAPALRLIVGGVA